MKCVILAGGIGNTLWPLSRRNYPKQFLNICEGRSLLQDTIVRNLPFADEFIIVTNESYKEIMESQLKAFQGLRYRIIYESKNCGTFAGMYFGEFIEKYGEEVVGWKSSSLDRFPVLIKFIDAKNALSIQIHPDDYALENENEFGKNEMWYVVDCEPGAYLYCGLKQDSSKEEIRERIENNTITEILNKIEVHKGDCVMVKAGTIHAIGAGILICEIQQNSNCTYRMYDYDRKDKFGNRKELHIDKAIDVVDVKKYKPFVSGNSGVPEGAELLVSCKYFECYKYVLGKSMDVEDNSDKNICNNNGSNSDTVAKTAIDRINISVDTMSFRSIIVIEGSGRITVGENEMDYRAGDSFFVTAGEKVVSVEGTGVVIVTKV